MPDRYTAEAARAAGPDIDDECPAWAYERIEALERLVHAQHLALARLARDGAQPCEDWADLERRAVDLLDLDPPGFDPSTEGP